MNQKRKSLVLAVIFLSISVFAESEETPETKGPGKCNYPISGIVISPAVTHLPLRPLEVWWKCAVPKSGDWMGLFGENPTTSNLGKALETWNIKGESGWWTSEISAFVPSGDPYKEKCQHRWAAIISSSNRTIGAVSCLETLPTWMDDMKYVLGFVPLNKVFFPGTHESGSIRRYTHTQPNAETYDLRHLVCQEETILNQLIVGARYLDLRVSHYTMYSSRWFLNHGSYWMSRLKDAIEQIQTFMKMYSNEIVVVDVHDVSTLKVQGITPKIHDELVKFITYRLKDYLVPPSLGWNATMRQVWASGKRLILSYNNQNTVDRHKNTLWSPILQKFGNVGTLDTLRKFLRAIQMRIPKGPWATMAELTATMTDILFEEQHSLRYMAETVNKHVSDWYYDKWGDKANIVAVDYIRSTNIVRAAIAWNRYKGENYANNQGS